MIWDTTKKAALAVGATVGTGLVAVAGAPLWAGIMAGSAAAIATPKLVDIFVQKK